MNKPNTTISKQNKMDWGAAEDLQADIRFESTACQGHVMDFSIGCPFQCVYCIFSKLGPLVYKLKNPEHKDAVIPLKLDKFLQRKEFPEGVLLGYTSDPLGSPEITKLTVTALKKLIANNVHVNLVTKGVVTDELLDVIKMKPDLIRIQTGIISVDDERNRIVETGAPSYQERIASLEKISNIKDLKSLSVRIDPLLPGIDDTEENIRHIIGDLNDVGVKMVIIGYIIVTRAVRERLGSIDYLSSSAKLLSEKVETISEQEVFSFPFDEKMKKLAGFQKIVQQYDLHMKVCGCKDVRLQKTSLDWICHSD